MPLWINGKLKAGQIYHPLENKAFNTLFVNLRGRFGSENIAMSETLRRIIQLKNEKQKTIIATGEISAKFIKKLVNLAKMSYNIGDTEVVGIKNELFSGKVTVSGLLGASDLFRELDGIKADRILITESMLKQDEDIFLDDITLKEASEKLGIEIIPVRNDGECFLAALLGY